MEIYMTIELFFATNNKGKVKEAEYILNKYGVVLKPIAINKIEIQSNSLREIAVYAVKSIYKIIGKPVVVEDSGLFIDALNGFPGPYSSYVYKTIGLKGILKLLDGVIDRKAKFIAVVALAFNDNVYVFEGSIEGYISLEIRGDKGFGFDPIFIPVGSNKTFGEMDIEEKSMYSHRGKAFKELATWVLNNKDKLFNTE
uniref:dITP/XTP pyrophosphatase n=1 Tax=Ignisphaera aggregans TaxID=334771 RepID=A0A7J3QFG8_9CREN